VTKQVNTTPAPVANPDGTYTVSYTFGVSNKGNVAISNISLLEDFATQYGCAFAGNAQDPVVTPVTVTGTAPTANTGYLGSGLNADLLNNDGTLLPGDTLTVSVVVDIDPSCSTAASPLDNQASVSGTPSDATGTPLTDVNGNPLPNVMDDSDDNTDYNSDDTNDNETGGTDDPTLLYLPNVSVTKAVKATEILADDDVKLTFEFEVANTGNTIMTNLSLDDPLTFFPTAAPGTDLNATNTMIMITNVDATTLPGANGSYDGETITEMLNGVSGELAPGESFLVTLMTEVDAAAFGGIMPQPVTNQAVVSGIPEDGMGNTLINPTTGVAYVIDDVTDNSDDGTGLPGNGDPNDPNTGAEGEGLGPNDYDDPTPIVMPGNINVVKMMTGIPTPAASNQVGNYDATYQFEICNTGGVDLINIDLVDNLNSEFGAGYVGVVTAPSIATASTNATLVDPTPNTSYTGFSPMDNLLNGDGGLEPGQCITVEMEIEVDISEMPMPAFNQAEVTGTDPDGNELTDLSDDNTDLDGDGEEGDNNTGGSDDPTGFPPVPEISIVKQLSDAVSQPNGDVKLTFEMIVENTGNTYLDDLSLVDDLSGFLPAADPATQDIKVVITNIDADMAPTAGAGYDGVATTEMLATTDGNMASGQKYMVTLMVEVSPVDFAQIMPQPITNQSVASGTPVDENGVPVADPTDPTGMALEAVMDNSDDGSDPNSDNPSFPGDMGTTDDPTPIMLPGAIDLSKELTMIVPATTPGNAIATYEFVVRNIGGTDLTEISLIDDFANEFGSGYIGVETVPTISMSVSGAMSTDPTANASFTGYATGNDLLVGTDGTLIPDDSVTVTVVVELDMDQLPDPALNQGIVSASDPNGMTIEDDSDDNSDIDGDGNNDMETGGEDDPTGLPPFPSVDVAKSVNMVVNSPTSPDHYYVTYRHIIQNTGNTVLEDMILTDDMVTALQGGYVQTKPVWVCGEVLSIY